MSNRIIVLFARLVNESQRLPAKRIERGAHRPVERPRAAAPAEDEQAEGRLVLFLRHAEELGSHRAPRVHGLAPEAPQRFFVGHRRPAHHRSQEPVGQAGFRVGLEQHGGPTPERRREHGRPGRVATHAEDHLRVKLPEQPGPVQQAAHEQPRAAQLRRRPYALETRHRQGAQGKARRGHHLGFNSLFGAHEQNLVPRMAAPELGRHGQRRENMASGAAARHHHLHRPHRRQSAYWLMFSSKPTPSSITSKSLPP